DIQVVTLPVAAIPRARVMNDTRGVLKAIVDNKTQRILGASLLCVDSHEMINIVKMVMDAGLPYSILRDQIFTHPSMSESLKFGAISDWMEARDLPEADGESFRSWFKKHLAQEKKNG
ncbi:hypothetical protein ACUOFC_02025, partial [Escherichia sp. TWPC-MK]